VFAPGRSADISWTADCVQMCLMVPRPTLESKFEELLGCPPKEPLRFDFAMDLMTPIGVSFRGALQMVAKAFVEGAGLSLHPMPAVTSDAC
jgi:hypothetical protein